MVKRFYFCPNCRYKIDTPKMLLNPNMKFGGKVVINCGNCNKDGKGNKKGKIVIKGTPLPPTEENQVDNENSSVGEDSSQTE